MNIALVSDTFYPTVGGTERVVLALCNEYVKMGHNVALFVRDDYEKRPYDDSVYPFKVVRAKMHKFPFYPPVPLTGCDKALKDALYDFKPDVMHIQTQFEMGKWGVKMAKKLNIPSVVTCHTNLWCLFENNAPFSKSNPIHKAILFINNMMPKYVAKHADILTAVSESCKRDEIQRSLKVDREVFIVRNGFDYTEINRFSVDENRISKDSPDFNRINLLYVGRVASHKNIDFSFKVCSVLKKRGIPFDFTLAGLDKRDRYKTKAEALGLSDNVHCIGVQKFDVLAKLYSPSDIFLFPSIYDTDGLVVKEANKFGTIALVVKDTGASEQIRDGINGYALDEDENAFADKIEELYRLKTEHFDQYLELRKGCKNKPVPSWTDIATQYLDLYQNKYSNATS